MWFFAGSKPAIEFYSGWLTEYSLCIDNLFVFVIIMSNFAVPKQIQKYVLSIGITIAFVFRGVFILIGAAMISRFTWVFFLFGAFLIVTAVKLVLGGDEDEEYHENGIIRESAQGHQDYRRLRRRKAAHHQERRAVTGPRCSSCS